MHFTTRTLVPAAAFAFALGVSPLMAQQQPSSEAPAQQPAPAPGPSAPAAQVMSVEGELLRVNAEAKTLAVRDAEAKEQQFRFTDSTEITGAGRNVEGLATMTGTRVKVDYKTEGSAKVATKIEIHERAAEQPQPQARPDAPQSPQPQQ